VRRLTPRSNLSNCSPRTSSANCAPCPFECDAAWTASLVDVRVCRGAHRWLVGITRHTFLGQRPTSNVQQVGLRRQRRRRQPTSTSIGACRKARPDPSLSSRKDRVVTRSGRVNAPMIRRGGAPPWSILILPPDSPWSASPAITFFGTSDVDSTASPLADVLAHRSRASPVDTRKEPKRPIHLTGCGRWITCSGAGPGTSRVYQQMEKQMITSYEFRCQLAPCPFR